jgi:hypothetical protein
VNHGVEFGATKKFLVVFLGALTLNDSKIIFEQYFPEQELLNNRMKCIFLQTSMENYDEQTFFFINKISRKFT